MNKLKLLLKSIKPIDFIVAGALTTVFGSLSPTHTKFLFATPITINIITFIGGLITAIAAYYHNLASSAKSSNILNNTISNLKQIQELTTQNTDLSVKTTNILNNTVDNLKQVQDLTTQNAELSLQLSEARIQLHGYIAGGDNNFIISFIEGENIFLFTNCSKFPMYDISLRFVDVSKPNGKPFEFTQENLGENFEIGNIGPGLGKFFKGYKINWDIDYQKINAHISTRNGYFIQYIRNYKQNNAWIHAVKLSQHKDGKFISIYEKIHPDFSENRLEW